MVFWLDGATALRAFPEAEPLPSSQYRLCITGGQGFPGALVLGGDGPDRRSASNIQGRPWMIWSSFLTNGWGRSPSGNQNHALLHNLSMKKLQNAIKNLDMWIETRTKRVLMIEVRKPDKSLHFQYVFFTCSISALLVFDPEAERDKDILIALTFRKCLFEKMIRLWCHEIHWYLVDLSPVHPTFPPIPASDALRNTPVCHGYLSFIGDERLHDRRLELLWNGSVAAGRRSASLLENTRGWI